MRKLYLRDVIGNDKITNSYFTTDLIYFYDIPYENIAFCRGNNESAYKQYIKSKTLNYYSLYDMLISRREIPFLIILQF